MSGHKATVSQWLIWATGLSITMLSVHYVGAWGILVSVGYFLGVIDGMIEEIKREV